jgi:cytochrome c biogenesis protein CcmG/thiol:disulfide interchange protein DsbE
MMKYIWPFVAFVVLAGFLYKGLSLHPSEVPSPFINKPAPAFTLPQLHQPDKNFSPADMKGKVWLFNLWASWCESCREEHPELLKLARQNVVPIIGLDYKDKREAAENWLSRGGDPYVLNAFDAEGRIGLDYGVTGVPETFVIDKQGVIRDKIIGVVTPQNFQERILPLIRKLEQQP